MLPLWDRVNNSHARSEILFWVSSFTESLLHSGLTILVHKAKRQYLLTLQVIEQILPFGFADQYIFSSWNSPSVHYTPLCDTILSSVWRHMNMSSNMDIHQMSLLYALNVFKPLLCFQIVNPCLWHGFKYDSIMAHELFRCTVTPHGNMPLINLLYPRRP